MEQPFIVNILKQDLKNPIVLFHNDVTGNKYKKVNIFWWYAVAYLIN